MTQIVSRISSDYVKHVLNHKALDVKLKSALLQANPLGKLLVALGYGIYQLACISKVFVARLRSTISLRHNIKLTRQSVDERNHARGNHYLSALFDAYFAIMFFLAFLHARLVFSLFYLLLLLLILGLTFLLPFVQRCQQLVGRHHSALLVAQISEI